MKNLSLAKIYIPIIVTIFVLISLFLNLELLQAQPTPTTTTPGSNTTTPTQPGTTNPTQTNQTLNTSTNTINSASPGGSTGSETGLVKCGVSRDCTICDIFILIRDVFNFALGLLATLAVLSIVIGGFYVVTSAGNSGRVSEGYSIITNAVIGLLLVMASFLLFSFVLVVLGFQSANFSAIFDFQDGQIFSVKCDNASTFNDRGQNGGGVPTTPSGPIDIGALNVACLSDPTLTGELSAVLRAISVYETPSRGGADSYKLPPNRATASGRYQIINSTWSGWSAAAGVSERTTSAYQASPASQDRAAAWWLRDNNITTCDSFAASARANVCSYRGACQWTPVPGCAACSNDRFGQPNDTTRAYPDFAALCKTLDADNCP